MQEHVESGLIQAYIEHKPIERFVINTHLSTTRTSFGQPYLVLLLLLSRFIQTGSQSILKLQVAFESLKKPSEKLVLCRRRMGW